MNPTLSWLAYALIVGTAVAVFAGFGPWRYQTHALDATRVIVTDTWTGTVKLCQFQMTGAVQADYACVPQPQPPTPGT